MSGRKPTEDELRQWHAAMRNVRPMAGSKPPKPPESKSRKKPDVAVKKVKVGATKPTQASTLDPTKPQDRSAERNVRRGQQTFGAKLDLHGHTQDSAWSLLPAFLSTAQSRGERCVIVITGKGREGEGVLRRNFLRWLEQREAAHLVSGYAQAHPRHGGRGAWYVYLRRR
ncbi:MAG: Smr/MutS family protein [Pseudomonadota bacterium]